VPTAGYGVESEGPGAQIGPYKLISILGEGGYGFVYLADQHEPVRRRVAAPPLHRPGLPNDLDGTPDATGQIILLDAGFTTRATRAIPRPGPNHPSPLSRCATVSPGGSSIRWKGRRGG
jgi:hypothetical protein